MHILKQMFDSLSDVAKEIGVRVGIKHTKINISNPRVSWEHEQFSKVRVIAATLSELFIAPELFKNTGGLHDTRSSVDDRAICKSVKIVVESFARHIYKHKDHDIQIFANNSSLAIDLSYIKSWLNLLSRTPRVALFLSTHSWQEVQSAFERKDATRGAQDERFSHDFIYEGSIAKLLLSTKIWLSWLLCP